MVYSIFLDRVQEIPILAVSRRATLQELPVVVPRACGVVWDYIRGSGLRSHGRNVAVYLNDRIDLEVGVEVGTDAAGGAEVSLSTIPGGMVASTVHLGPYSGLREAHRAVREWCQASRQKTAGPYWEIYGHWTEILEELRTDVCYLLVPDGASSG
jgi:effector-binding domain-containing protein